MFLYVGYKRVFEVSPLFDASQKYRQVSLALCTAPRLPRQPDK